MWFNVQLEGEIPLFFATNVATSFFLLGILKLIIMKRFYWNFVKNTSKRPELEDIIKNVTTVICPYVRLNAKPEECHIREMFEEGILHVGYPPKALPEGEFFDLEYEEEGSILRGTIIFPGSDHNERTHKGYGKGRYFSIKGGVLYIGKVVY